MNDADLSSLLEALLANQHPGGRQLSVNLTFSLNAKA